MTLRLRNTLTRQVEPVEPLEPGRASGCTPAARPSTATPMSATCAAFLLADLIRRALLYHGIDVLHVKNITDVGHLRDEGFDRGADRMLVAAGLEHKTPAEIADAYEAAFHADEALGQHPAGPRLPAGHRAHPRDARARRGARGRRPRLRDS